MFNRVQKSIKSNLFELQKKRDDIITNHKLSSSKKHINAFWWRNVLNFGDLYTPELLNYYGYSAVHSSPKDADIIGIGSILGKLDNSCSGYILGSGLLSTKKCELGDTKVAAVRGEYTKKILSLPESTPTGDFGLLAEKIVSSHRKKYSIGIVPHYVDQAHPWLREIKKHYGKECLMIEVQGSAKEVANKIAQCECIVSSSLHGLITADSLGIPNMWIQLSDQVIGDGFKFDDYNSAINYEQKRVIINDDYKTFNFDKELSDKSQKTIKEKKLELEIIFENVIKQVYLASMK